MRRKFVKVTLLGCLAAIAATSGGQTGGKSKSKKTTTKSSVINPSPAVRQTGLDNALIDPQHFNHQALSVMVFDLTNVERCRVGLRPLTENAYLAQAATAHSQDMAARQYFNHKSKGLFNRTDPRARAQATGYNPGMIAENIAMIPTYNSTRIQTVPGTRNQVVDADYNSYRRLAEYAMQEWMKSPGHRKNIMDGKLSSLGVGTAIGLKNNVPYVYLTQNFGG